ncbi:Stringent starvation protein B homolog [Phocoenobacter uteri]|uniref:Stringent starvation protein B homolog n=1 Tax=Phocoenobacter uteri TaxID=146806 RepID=A0A379CAC1_9PAST|nr:ClpXP protease specificity-enhancing factor [Phocoenobacter uteri]MDG6882522.1 ClpXP protease specificity-enhancing factor [Phocoenobacter uteri]SUB58685.1 Stringent starvation protein B homolog [Phocoenobacter uteri]
MKPLRPYLFNAYYNWIIDNNNTPYILVNAEYLNTDVPKEYINEGRIILSLSPTAIGKYIADEDAISFDARFGGMLRDIYIPFGAMIALYAQETGDGVMFQEEEYFSEESYSARLKSVKSETKQSIKTKPRKNSKLKLVK